MEYVRLLLDLLAVIGGSSMASLLSPWRMQARAVPALLFVVGMIVMVLPMLPVAALAMMLPAAWLQRYLGIDLHGHEPVNVAPAVAKAKSAAQAARERIRPSKPEQITRFVDRAYPAPGEPGAAELEHDAAAEDDDLDQDEPASPAEQMTDRLELAAQGLPAQYRDRLAGQRAGRDTSVGIRSQHTPVRSFVPSLLG